MAVRFSLLAKLRTASLDNLDGVAACWCSPPVGLKKKRAIFKWGVSMHKRAADGAGLAQASPFLQRNSSASTSLASCVALVTTCSEPSWNVLCTPVRYIIILYLICVQCIFQLSSCVTLVIGA